MRNVILILLVIATGLVACEKKQSTPPPEIITPPPPPPPPPAPDTSYAILGFKNLEINDIGSASMPLDVVSVTGDERTIKLSVSGLPENAKASFHPSGGLVPFSTTLNIYTDLSPVGVYVLTITATNDNGTTRAYKVKLHVTKTTDCFKEFIEIVDTAAGKISVYTLASSTLVHDTVKLRYDDPYQTPQLFIDNLVLRFGSNGNYYFKNLPLYVDCANNKLTLNINAGGIDVTGGVKSFHLKGEGYYDEVNKTWQLTYVVRESYYDQTQLGVFEVKGTLK